jgi:hypothetical protein
MVLMPLILARLTVSGMAVMSFLVLKWNSAAPDETARHFLTHGG